MATTMLKICQNNNKNKNNECLVSSYLFFCFQHKKKFKWTQLNTYTHINCCQGKLIYTHIQIIIQDKHNRFFIFDFFFFKYTSILYIQCLRWPVSVEQNEKKKKHKPYNTANNVMLTLLWVILFVHLSRNRIDMVFSAFFQHDESFKFKHIFDPRIDAATIGWPKNKASHQNTCGFFYRHISTVASKEIETVNDYHTNLIR